MILISVAPRVLKQGIVPGAVWKQLMFSGTSSISATIAKLCSSSSILSSLIVKNVDTGYVVLSAGIIIPMVSALKSGSGRSEREFKKSSSNYILKYTTSFYLVYIKGQPIVTTHQNSKVSVLQLVL